MLCLCAINKERLGNNYIMYESSITPEHQPGNGGFSVIKFSLETLYSMHEQCRNWWTVGNDNLPICRYLGTTITVYQSENVDIVLRYDNTYPMEADHSHTQAANQAFQPCYHKALLYQEKKHKS